MADSKITALTALVTLLGTDIFPVVSDPGGTPVTKKITAANVAAFLASLAEELTNKTLTLPKLNEAVALTCTATELNLLHGKLGAGTSFTPAWSGITEGNGTNVGAYIELGKLIYGRAEFTFGSTSSATGNIGLALPVTKGGYNGTYSSVIGEVTMYDSGTGNQQGIIDSGGSIYSLVVSGANIIRAVVNATAPFTWATGDVITTTFLYERN